MEKLCDDISREILIRLPAKAIAQLRCVCKRWNTLLHEANFIESHLRRSINNTDKDEILLCFNRGYPIRARSSASPDVELNNFIKLPVNFPSEKAQRRKTTSIIGAANGLVCFSVGCYDDRVIIYVWNPSLSALLTIPVPIRSPNGQNCFLRFGFDPQNDDYKILKFIRVTGKKGSRVEVYSMRSGCCKLITQRFPSRVPYVYSNNILQVCVDGHLHWLCFNVDLKIKTIVAYDLAAESFSEISLPNPMDIVDYDHRLWWVSLGVFGGKLCVISCARDVDYYQMWVLDQYGSWVNSDFSLSHFHEDGIIPYGFTLKNNFIYQDCKRELNLYNLAAPFNKVKPFRNPYFRHFIIIPYVESLVWVTPPSATC